LISRLQGKLIGKVPPRVVIDCHGVGYEVEVPLTTLWSLPDLQADVTLLTHLVVRDDAHLLFGFATEDERQLFRSLIKVSGIGAKVALAILSGIEVGDFIRCVHENDTAKLTTVPGIGKKTAERLIVELRDRVGDWARSDTPTTPTQSSATPDAVSDAISGLITLGYKPPEASRLVLELETTGKSSEAIIRETLKKLA